MPYVAHKRLVTVIHIPYHTVYYGGTLIPIRVHTRIRPSVIAAELNRIRNLTRPSTESYVEKYLQSKDHIVSLPKISPPISLFQRKEKKEKKTVASFTAIKHECRSSSSSSSSLSSSMSSRHVRSSNHSCIVASLHDYNPLLFDDIWHHRSAESRRLFYTDKFKFFTIVIEFYIYTYMYYYIIDSTRICFNHNSKHV